MFEKTRLKLTAWYLLIIMTISLAFSAFIYVEANREFDRILRVQRFRIEHPVEFRTGQYVVQNLPEPFDPDVMNEAKLRVLIGLIEVNLVILILSSLAGYFLAGRTLKPIKEMLEDQNRFVTDASHELRTPLTALRAEIEVGLRNKNMSINDAKKLLESNLEETVALQVLSDNLLELSKNREEKLQTEHVSLSKTVDQALKTVKKLAQNKKITIENKVTELATNGFSEKLSQVFVILLDNAIKYSNAKSKIEIGSKKERDKILISVTDHGIGIDEADIPHVFDRFYRANKSRSKKGAGGYGLGLSIAKKIIENYDGSIFVKSIPDHETVFTVSLPLRLFSE